MSMMEVIQYYHPEFKGMKYLEEKDCRFLIIMDSLDCYLAPLDWEVSHLLTFAAETIEVWIHLLIFYSNLANLKAVNKP